MKDKKPLHLMFEQSASPTAHHTPVPVPIHWQDDVKTGLDQDVRLGVIEPKINQHAKPPIGQRKALATGSYINNVNHWDSTEPSCCSDGWRIALTGSRFTNKSESKYYPIVTDIGSCTLGCSNLIVYTNHKPLLNIFSDRSLNDIPNSRLRDLEEKTLPFRFKIKHIPGLKNIIPNALSRSFVGDAPDDIFEEKSGEIMSSAPSSKQ